MLQFRGRVCLLCLTLQIFLFLLFLFHFSFIIFWWITLSVYVKLAACNLHTIVCRLHATWNSTKYRQPQLQCNTTNRNTLIPCLRVSFRMILSDLEWLSEIFNDTKQSCGLSPTAELVCRNQESYSTQWVENHTSTRPANLPTASRDLDLWPPNPKVSSPCPLPGMLAAKLVHSFSQYLVHIDNERTDESVRNIIPSASLSRRTHKNMRDTHQL